MLLGVLVASSTLSVVGQDPYEFSGRTYFFFAPSLSLLHPRHPMLDTVFAVVRRAGQRTSPAVADLNHLHHRLMRLGHGHRAAVIILWAWTALLSGLVLWPGVTTLTTRSRRLPWAPCRLSFTRSSLPGGGPVPATVTTSAGLVKKRRSVLPTGTGRGQASDVDVEAHRGHGPAGVVGAGQPGVVARASLGGEGRARGGEGRARGGDNGHRGREPSLQLRPLLPRWSRPRAHNSARRPGRALRAHPGRALSDVRGTVLHTPPGRHRPEELQCYGRVS